MVRKIACGNITTTMIGSDKYERERLFRFEFMNNSNFQISKIQFYYRNEMIYAEIKGSGQVFSKPYHSVYYLEHGLIIHRSGETTIMFSPQQLNAKYFCIPGFDRTK